MDACEKYWKLPYVTFKLFITVLCYWSWKKTNLSAVYSVMEIKRTIMNKYY